MENSMSKILTGAVVKKTLKEMKESPERSIRNLIDMALQFSGGGFQQDFFTAAQTMLQNENSAYYQLMRNVISYTDSERLYTFGMNLGYNGCTTGAQRIRESEKLLGCNIPWAAVIQIDGGRFEEREQKYQTTIQEGEKLGIYTWMLLCSETPEKTLSIVKDHPDSAFFLFCAPEYLNADFPNEAADLYNLMPVIRYHENISELCDALRNREMLYSVWYPYGQKDTEIILNGDLFYSAQELYPIFTVLLPAQGCPDVIRQLVYQTLQQARREQLYHTLLWELSGDNCLVDAIISDDACSVYFDADGNINNQSGRIACNCHNLFQSSLASIFADACPKKAGK